MSLGPTVTAPRSQAEPISRFTCQSAGLMNLQTAQGLAGTGTPIAVIEAASAMRFDSELNCAALTALSMASTFAAMLAAALAEAAAEAEAEALAAALAFAEAASLRAAIAFRSSLAVAEATADAEALANMFTPRPALTFAIAANDANTFIRLACGTVIAGNFMALIACTNALSCPSGSGIANGNPSAAEAFAKALS